MEYHVHCTCIYVQNIQSIKTTDSNHHNDPICSPNCTRSPGDLLNSKSSGASNTITMVDPRLNSPIQFPFVTSTPVDEVAALLAESVVVVDDLKDESW